MKPRNWKVWRPQTLQEAVEGCVSYAQHNARKSVDQIADLVAENGGTIYKWMATGNIPARKIAGFEHACGASYVSGYLAASSRKLVIDLPTGRMPSSADLHGLQEACTAAVGAVIAYAQGKKAADETIDFLTAAIHRLAVERAHVERQSQPELPLS